MNIIHRPLTVLIGACFLPFTVVAAPSSVGLFDAPVNYAVGGGPRAPLTADFNGDGLVDIAVLNRTSDNISVHLNTGAGLLSEAVFYPIGELPYDATLVDLNLDGIPDIVAACNVSDTVSVLLGIGDGTFADAVDYATFDEPYYIATGEFTGDAYPDLVITNEIVGNTFQIIPGNGDGTLGTPVTHTHTQPIVVEVADMDGDGHDDLIFSVYGAPARIDWLKGDGAGGFTDMGMLYNNYGTFVITQLDGGALDVIAARILSPNSYVLTLLGDGDGTVTFEHFSDLPYFVLTMATDDFNLDGYNDLAVSSSTGGGMGVLMGDGAGELGTQTLFPSDGQAFDLTTGDINGDGWPDGVVISPQQGLQLFFNRRGGSSNLLPVADAGADIQVETVGAAQVVQVTLDGSASSDADGSIVSWEWSWDFGNSTASGETAMVDLSAGVHYVGLTVTDDDGESSTATVAIEVVQGDLPPIAVAGSDLTATDDNLTGTATVMLDGSGSTDPEGPIATWQWSWDGGSADGETVEVEFPIGTTVVTLTVTDAIGLTATDEVSIHVFRSPYAERYNERVTDAGDGASDFVAADFDGDGWVDLAVVNATTGDLTLFHPTGDGTYVEGESLATGIAPSHIITGHFNNDGVPDLAVMATGANQLRYYLAESDGTFDSYTSLPLSGSGWQLYAEDLNDDGLDDILIYDSFGILSTYMNTAGSGFGTANSKTIGYARSVTTGDFDGDGVIDFVIADDILRKALILYSGNGDGTFADGENLYEGHQYYSQYANDFNGDGVLDIALMGRVNSNDELQIYLGKGDGVYAEPYLLDASGFTSSIASGDFNGDGFIDLACAHASRSRITLYLGNGDGGFNDYIELGDPVQPRQLLAVDTNGDGRSDLLNLEIDEAILVSYFVPTNLKLVRMYPEFTDAYELTSGDLNGDEWPDFAYLSFTDKAVRLLYGNADGRLTEGTAITGMPVTASDVEIIDFNGDGFADIFVNDSDTRSYLTFYGQSDGSFVAGENITQTGSGPRLFEVADLNNDGFLDFITYNFGGFTLLFGDSLGTVDEQLSVSFSANVTDFELIDLNEDGWLDVLASVQNMGVVVLYGDSGSTYTNQALHSLDGTRFNVDTGDFNADGIIDIVAGNEESGTVYVLYGLAEGGFDEAVEVPALTQVVDLVVADFNGDFLDDIALCSYQDYSTIIIYQKAEGGFELPVYYSTQPEPFEYADSLNVADLNQDSLPDIVATKGYQGNITVLINHYTRPVADLGSDILVTDSDLTNRESVLLDGSASNHPAGQIVEWIWSWEGGTTQGETANASFPTGTTVVTLTVSDSNGTSAKAQFNVTVEDLDIDDDGLPDTFEWAIINAVSGDAYTELADVSPTTDFNLDGLLDGWAYFFALSAITPSEPSADFPFSQINISPSELVATLSLPSPVPAGVGLRYEMTNTLGEWTTLAILEPNSTSWQLVGNATVTPNGSETSLAVPHDLQANRYYRLVLIFSSVDE
jgi:hypothetical protein